MILKNSSTGQGLTGLTSASSGLIVSTIADNEATPTTYTAAGSTIETISTLGTFAAPTATKCRFKEIDATNHKGAYEFQFADARFSVASSKRLVISITGAASLLDTDYEVQLVQFDPYAALATPTNITAGTITTTTNLTNLPAITTDWLTGTGVAASAVTKIQAGLATPTNITAGTITTTTNLTNAPTSGDFTATMKTSIGTAVAASNVAGITGVTFPSTVASPTNITAGTITTVTTLTNLPAITTDWLTGTGVAASAVTKIQAGLATPTNITAGTITTTTNLTNLPAVTTDWLTGTGVAASAVTKIQSGLSTYAGGDTSGTTTLLARLTSTRAGNLDFLTATPPTAAAIATAVLTDTGDNSTTGSPGKILAQLGAAFTTTSSSVFSTASLANAPTGGSAPTASAIATAVLTTQMTESYNADGAAPTLAQAQFMQMQRLTEFSIAASTITVKKLDGTTTAYTLTMDAAAGSASSSTRAT